jgi:hypothetical protein
MGAMRGSNIELKCIYIYTNYYFIIKNLPATEGRGQLFIWMSDYPILT